MALPDLLHTLHATAVYACVWLLGGGVRAALNGPRTHTGSCCAVLWDVRNDATAATLRPQRKGREIGSVVARDKILYICITESRLRGVV